MMDKETATKACDLCGLPMRRDNRTAVFGGQTRHFCCGGCVMVYTMLMEATDAPDPSSFKESERYRRCVAAGVVPAAEADLNGAVENSDREAPQAPDESAAREMLPLQLNVSGMWCPACAWVIRAALDRQDGVSGTGCDFATDRLHCRYDPVRTDPDTIMETVEKLGYRPSLILEKGKKSPWQREFVRLIISALLSANVMMLSWSLYSGFFIDLSGEDIRYISWPIVVLATGVMVYGGGPLFRKAWWGLRAGAPGMETLVCLGATSAYFYSVYNFMGGNLHLYFDTAAMLITLVLLGKLLEAGAKSRVRRDLEGFLALQPNKVRLCSRRFPRGRFVVLEQLMPGDRFRVKAHEMVPADGRVVSGRGLVDESAVTGEARPKAIAEGRAITSGTRLIEGDVFVTARRVGCEALLGQMIAIIQSALDRRTPLESRTDRWLSLFVPLMAALAAATVLVGHGWGLDWEQAFVRGLTVLVVACPCALGIAIPLARIAGMSCAGQRGILVRDFEAFERAGFVNCAVMDKTGTLTHGRWSLEAVVPHGGITAKRALALASGLEKGVDHAVARAVSTHASKLAIAPADVTDVRVSENGVTGTLGSDIVRIGQADFSVPGALPLAEKGRAESQLSEVFLGVNGKLGARLGFGDKVRESAVSLIRHLQDNHCGLHLISGDTPVATQAVARELSIDHAQGGLLPKDKADYVARLQAGGCRVVMLGDGINDAPALAQADLSVAVYRDAALVRQAAAVTLMRGDPGQFVDFWDLSKQVNAKVVQNLGCAWIYNAIGIPIAMFGWLNPLIAATAMLLSSLTVIGNTLLLVRKRR
jgi:heavy metal translocating P-type ATPase